MSSHRIPMLLLDCSNNAVACTLELIVRLQIREAGNGQELVTLNDIIRTL